MNLIFLDIDGVLNCSTTNEKIDGAYRGMGDDQLKLLFSIVSKTNSKLVLISSWKEHWHKKPELKCKQDELANYLDKRLNEFNMHVSWKISNEFIDRGKAIKQFLCFFKEKGYSINFVILDDEFFDYKQEGLTTNLIHTNFNKGGLTISLANRAIDKLLI